MKDNDWEGETLRSKVMERILDFIDDKLRLPSSFYHWIGTTTQDINAINSIFYYEKMGN